MSEFSFKGLGGVDEIGASCYLYTFDATCILVDAGTRPNAIGEASLPDLKVLTKPPDAMLITHAHSDHIAALPLVHKRFPAVPIFSTRPTASIALAMLKDAVKVQKAQGAPLYNLEDVASTIAAIQLVEPFKAITIAGVTITPYPAGHLIGAVSYLFESPQGRVFHTGDVSNISGATVDACFQPTDAAPCDAVICESTYGDTISHTSRKSEVRRFVEAVNHTLARGGRVLVPAFALGRSSEVALILADHMMSGLMPKVPIVLDGLVRSIHDLLANALMPYLPTALQNRAETSRRNPLYPDSLVSVKDQRQRQALISSSKPMVVIASSGMLTAGVSPLYAKAMVPDDKNLLAFVGYQDEGAPGKRFLELTEQGGEVKLPTGPANSFETIPALCEIAGFSFSGHADAGGLLSLIKRYTPKRVVLVHGDGGSRYTLGKLLRKVAHVEWPNNGEDVDLAAATFLEKRQAQPHANASKKRTKMVRFDTTVQARLTGQTLSLEFAEDVDVQHLLGTVDTFAVEIAKGDRLRLKLREKVAFVAAEEGISDMVEASHSPAENEHT